MGPEGRKASSGSGHVCEFAPSDVLRLAGGSESGLFSALACELSEYASIDLPAAERAIDAAVRQPDPSSEDSLGSVAWAVKVSAADPWLIERLRVGLSVARHFGKESLLCLGAGAGCEAVAFAGLGMRTALADWPGPVRDFVAWRLAKRGIEVELVSPAELPDRRFDTVYCSRFNADTLDRAGLIADLVCRMAEDAILYLAPDSPVYVWGQQHLAVLCSKGLRRAWDCGHLLVYCNDAPVYREVPLATQVDEMTLALRRADSAA